MEPVYDSVITFARGMFAAQGLKFTVTGSENVPRVGGAVLVMNHVGYLDFTYAGLGARPAKRLVRFMAKQEVFEHPVAGPLMRGMHHIPVDRAAGAGSYHSAVEALRAGEIIGVFPEATISRSFELKGFKSGAARMAAEAGVPLLPMIIWGSQRVWTKGHPKRLGRTNTPIHIDIEPPVSAEGNPAAVTKQLHTQMSAQLEKVRAAYPEHPKGAFWVPASLGGGAPTLEDAEALDREETKAKVAARRAKMEELRKKGKLPPTIAPAPSSDA
ncbi:lysophospholipid acyltransferase family protein [Rhodococcus sp. X156]|uniref:lysophospholipid acyltransferase family protein n=1 Tax=Rhodococcus sp. X156 TaxID=2499145 RepID=UPI000FDA82CB|nr:lysophospholipid acyltransferase family protein [Rhodococcus sp. X156]